MALGNKIVLTPEPRGRRIEGVMSVAMYPGIVVQVVPGSSLDGGNRLSWQPFDKSGSGKPGLVGILDFDWQQGRLATDQYEAGKRGFIYFPLAGDELNMLLHDVAGTSGTSDFAVGDPLMVQDGTGKLVDALVGTASALSSPFQVMETVTDMTADTLTQVMFTGF